MDERNMSRLTPPDEEIRALYARLDDLTQAAERGEMGMTAYLTPREVKYARAYLSHRLTEGLATLFGGYDGAERARAVLFPGYIEGTTDPEKLSAAPVEALTLAGWEDLAATLRTAVTPLRIHGSGYKVLTHRDYMGALMGAGLAREAFGDILVEDDATAVVICGGKVTDFLLTGLERVGADTVRVTRLPDGETPVAHRRTQPIQDTVASERLDCVVAALCHLSREKAQTLIRSRLCELDYEVVEDCAHDVLPPATLSVRGYGKYVVSAFDGETRKGRLRLRAGKYI